jgi:hypothetical protein
MVLVFAVPAWVRVIVAIVSTFVPWPKILKVMGLGVGVEIEISPGSETLFVSTFPPLQLASKT